MGTSQSREDGIIDSDCEEEEEEAEEQYDDALGDHQKSRSSSVKLYLHIGGNTPKAKWVISERLTSYNFVKTAKTDGNDDGLDGAGWVLEVGSKVRVRVSTEMQLKMFGDQRRVDFVDKAVWALKMFMAWKLVRKTRSKVYGKEFIGWVKPEVADDSMWEDAKDHSTDSTLLKGSQGSMEELEEAANGGVQSLALGALDNSFLVNDIGVHVYRNLNRGINGKGIRVKYDSGGNASNLTPKKALLMRAETNKMLMSPANKGKPNATGLKQVDIETGKTVTEWKFEIDGTDIRMKDITNDAKGSQLDPSESTFLGLDDNILCQWDMRDKKGRVQDSATSGSPVLHWTQGHQFTRGTNFQCFASTGAGSIVVVFEASMRQAKTAFPGLGSPITDVDVTYDGKWVLGTTDTYLILICSLFTDKDGKTKTGFTGRMGNQIPAPRLLKLTPLDSHLAGNDNKFHGGHFSWVTENGKQERHVVATVGKFSVVWDFHQVKNTSHGCYRNQQGLKSCYCYKIVLKDESIVESRFMHDKYAGSDSPEAPLVVATPLKVSSISLSTRFVGSC
ncbi:Protein CYPRO4 [Gossypium arboreum]|uniref:Protein CYPRO4 n=1 Tax=Gossypium arboreum TaxID=29729 RepID=A0A0B0PYY6_GOSAR|nr:Protein CYPRO4 [Gossypium arboreum]